MLSDRKVLHGAYGTATKIELDRENLKRPDQAGTVSGWFCRIPSAHPLWSCYMLSVVHLREIAGAKPAVKRFPEATHELLVIALDPDLRPEPDKRESWQHLTPINVCVQFEVNTDEAAAEIAEQSAKACVDGYLFIEPSGIRGARDAWDRSIRSTAEHLRLGGHPQVPAREVSH